MYSKEALTLYEDLLNKVSPKVAYVKEAASIPTPAEAVKWITEFSKTLAPETSSLWKKTWPFLATAGMAGAPAYAIGKHRTQAASDWDKMKYGLGGLGVGLSAPLLYNLVKGGDLSALANRLGAKDYSPEYADFTSL
ncbi:MAG: hypothetical protein ACTSPI_00135 [Candidatus Heimdallarchaeaceae archaeon]